MGDILQNTVLPLFMRFVNTRGVRAIKDGMMFTMPLIIVGAVYLLLANLPIPQLEEAVRSIGNGALYAFLDHGYSCSFNIIAIVAALGIGYTWAKNDGWEPLSAGIISIAAFLILLPDYITGDYFTVAEETGEHVQVFADQIINPATKEVMYGGFAGIGSVIDKTWTDGRGLIGAILAGLITGLIYSAFMKRDIRIKMPEGVPDGIAAAFNGLIPCAVILTLFLVVFGVCDATLQCSPIEVIYRFLQVPLQHIGGTLPGVIVFETLIPLLWFFGVHGATVVNSVSQPIALMNQSDNARIFREGIRAGLSHDEAVAAIRTHGGHIFTECFQNCFQAITGSGITIGIVIFMVFFAKSTQMRQVGRLGLGCGIFNINEPVTFGTPIVLNPKLLVPFIVAPLFCNIGAYVLTDIGFIPYTYGFTLPWTTPPILSGLFAIGWQAALWQFISLVASFFIYLPFAKSVDNDYLKLEEELE